MRLHLLWLLFHASLVYAAGPACLNENHEEVGYYVVISDKHGYLILDDTSEAPRWYPGSQALVTQIGPRTAAQPPATAAAAAAAAAAAGETKKRVMDLTDDDEKGTKLKAEAQAKSKRKALEAKLRQLSLEVRYSSSTTPFLGLNLFLFSV
jgi:hypothetical protein